MGLFTTFVNAAKQDLEKQIRKASTQRLQLEYIGGLPGFKKKKLQLDVYQGQVSIDGRPARIAGVEWKEQHERSAGKAAAGAIVGSMLLPGIGTIAGAALGGRRADTSIAVITADLHGDTRSIYVRCNEKEFKDLAGL